AVTASLFRRRSYRRTAVTASLFRSTSSAVSLPQSAVTAVPAVCGMRREPRSFRPQRSFWLRRSGLKARLHGNHARGGWFRKFKPGRWYTAKEDGDFIRLVDGRRSERFPRDEVEIRSVADDEWEVREAARVALEREGQSLDYPSRM